MRNKICKSIFLIAIILILMIPNIQANIAKSPNLEKNKQANWTYIHGIGNYNITNDDILLSGTIFIGFRGTKLIFNEQIVITEENNIFLIATKHFLHAIIRI